MNNEDRPLNFAEMAHFVGWRAAYRNLPEGNKQFYRGLVQLTIGLALTIGGLILRRKQ